MTQLIDKSALVAEIERMMAEEMAIFEESLTDGSHEVSAAPVVYTRLQILLSAVNTLEVKEVDLEKTLDEWRNTHFHKKRNGLSGEYLTHETQLDIARLFFSLGLKAQKGEEV